MPGTNMDTMSRERHAVAWGAVKKNYHKNEETGKWEEGPSDD